MFSPTVLRNPRTPDESDSVAGLLSKIKAKRRDLAGYLAKSEPRHSWLSTSAIVCGALAAALTGGPGIGGEGFIATAKGTVSLGIPVWQALCLGATVFSVAGVIINGLLKSQDLALNVASARSCDAKLEGLETMLELRQVSVEQAAPLYTQYLTEIPHI